MGFVFKVQYGQFLLVSFALPEAAVCTGHAFPLQSGAGRAVHAPARASLFRELSARLGGLIYAYLYVNVIVEILALVDVGKPRCLGRFLRS